MGIYGNDANTSMLMENSFKSVEWSQMIIKMLFCGNIFTFFGCQKITIVFVFDLYTMLPQGILQGVQSLALKCYFLYQ